MARRRGRERSEVGATRLGLAWYTHAGWEQLHQVADDAQALDTTYEDWERGALAAIRELQSIGRLVRKVPIHHTP